MDVKDSVRHSSKRPRKTCLNGLTCSGLLACWKDGVVVWCWGAAWSGGTGGNLVVVVTQNHPTTLSAASVGFDRCTHAPIEVIRRSVSCRRRTKRPHLFSWLLPPSCDAIAAIFEYSFANGKRGCYLDTLRGGPSKGGPRSAHRSSLHRPFRISKSDPSDKQRKRLCFLLLDLSRQVLKLFCVLDHPLSLKVPPRTFVVFDKGARHFLLDFPAPGSD